MQKWFYVRHGKSPFVLHLIQYSIGQRGRKDKGGEKKMVAPYQPLYTVKEASQVLRVNTSKVYELINTGQLPVPINRAEKDPGLGSGTIYREVSGGTAGRRRESCNQKQLSTSPSGGCCSHPGRGTADPEAGADRRRADQAEP